MSTIFEMSAVELFVKRIHQLSSSNQAHWGKMNVAQMVQHCSKADEGLLGKRTFPRLFVGRLFGGMILKQIMNPDKPMKKNMPTHPELKKFTSSDFETDKSKWIELLQEYSLFSNQNILHPFFGKMTRDQVGKFVYKHTDHHLRQFGV